MAGIFGERLVFNQEKGPDVELIVHGDEWYARYETESGHSVIYDPELGLFCYAFLDQGRFVSSRIPVLESPPVNALLHGKESNDVRQEKIKQKLAARNAPDSSE